MEDEIKIQTNFEIIRDLITKSDVVFSEQIDLIQLFTKAEDKDLEPIAAMFIEDLRWVSKINENYKAKCEALSNNDMNKWKEIMQKEEADILAME